nr:glycosyltransferase [Desulfobacterales bacterium]
MKRKRFKNMGFISTRLAGTDGVSLETEKWAEVLERNKYRCFYLAGESDRPPEKCQIVSEAHFDHPEIVEINRYCFGKHTRPREISELIQGLKDYLKQKIYKFVKDFNIDIIIPENALAIPMNLPLGLAITEFIAETGFPTIAHHHDFYWERNRFLVNGVTDYLHWAFPPDLPSIQHVVINSMAGQELSYRKGISKTIIPNVYNFASPPPPPDEYCSDLRERIGIGKDDLFILQPTRVVPRKWIERAIEIVHQMNLKNPKLIISHSSSDEGDIYHERIREYAQNLGVEIISIDHMVGTERRIGANGEKVYTIGDIYNCADLVTYPSGYEGFGNAFLEAIYYRRPIVVNRYSIYISDIEPKGFDVITIDGFVTKETIRRIFEVLENQELRNELVEKNYRLGLKYFSYETLERSLLYLIDTLQTQTWRTA